MSTQTKSGRRTVLSDNSWIRRNAEEDEPIDDDPNFGKVVLSQKKSVDDVSSKSVEAEKTPVNSGTTYSAFSKSTASVNTSISAIVPPPPPAPKPPVPANTASVNTSISAIVPPPPPAPAPKPPVPAKNPVLKTPNTSSFTARVFSGANTGSKTLSSVKPSFGEKIPESQTTNGSEGMSVSTLKSSTPYQSQSEGMSVSTLKSSTPYQSQTTVSNTKTSSALDEILSSRTAEKPSARTQVRTVSTEIPARSPTLRSPLQTLQSRVSSRDACTVCGKPIAGDGKMILEELNIISHTSCFRCAVCRCDLGGLEAGKSLWVHRERVHCSRCFRSIRDQWYI